MPVLHKDLWLVVCMAALTAMEHGRKQLVRLHFQHQQEPVRQSRITDFFQPFVQPPAAPSPLQAGSAQQRRPSHVEFAAESAVVQFWMCLHNFADVGLRVQAKQRRQRWLRDVPADHPLLAVSNGRLIVNGGP